jgi:hypothetical protein
MIRARHLKLFRKVGVAALAFAALATGGNAQDSFHGKFALPPGDYTFTLPSNTAPYRFYIQGQGASAIIQATTAEERVVSERPQLNLVDIADVHTVQTFEAPELGATFTYWTLTQKHPGPKEARQKTVLQAAPASQAVETSTSIEVHTAGR